MTHVQTEIASQPECWVRAADLALSPALPSPGERVAVTGCGTSWFMAKAYAALREQAGQGETDAFRHRSSPSVPLPKPGLSVGGARASTRTGRATSPGPSF